MSQVWDFTKPFTPGQLEEFKVIFRGMPTYNEGDWVLSSDLPNLAEKVNYVTTPEDFALYIAYWDNNFNGTMAFDVYLKFFATMYDYALYAKNLAAVNDKEGTGCVPTVKFEEIFKMMKSIYAKLEGLVYVDVLKACENDGRVSIDKFVKHIDEHLKRK